MRILGWTGLALIVIVIALAIYESQPVTVSPVVSVASTTAADLPVIIAGTPSVKYEDPQYGFSIYYPATTILKTAGFDGYLPVTQTPLIAFTLDASLMQGTNLGEAGVYIGATTTPAIVSSCTAPSVQTGETMASSTRAINGTTFSVFDSTGAGAGNIYQEHVYRTVHDGTCLELAELLHSSEIGNYPAGTVTAFDEAKFSGILDAMVNTFTFK